MEAGNDPRKGYYEFVNGKFELVESPDQYVTEKIDGANLGVYKNDGRLYPVMRKGYDVRTSEYDLIAIKRSNTQPPI